MSQRRESGAGVPALLAAQADASRAPAATKTADLARTTLDAFSAVLKRVCGKRGFIAFNSHLTQAELLGACWKDARSVSQCDLDDGLAEMRSWGCTVEATAWASAVGSVAQGGVPAAVAYLHAKRLQ